MEFPEPILCKIFFTAWINAFLDAPRKHNILCLSIPKANSKTFHKLSTIGPLCGRKRLIQVLENPHSFSPFNQQSAAWLPSTIKEKDDEYASL